MVAAEITAQNKAGARNGGIVERNVRSAKRFAEEVMFRCSRQVPKLASRRKLASLLNARGLTGTGFEIGVFEGAFSNYLLEYWRGEKLVSIDPWLTWAKDEYRDGCNREQEKMDAFYAATQRLLAPYGKRSEIWRTTSQEASVKVPDNSLDFVYLDAMHHEEAVTDDISYWYPKLRTGGMLAGHDYMNGTFPFGVFGVKTAVDRFVGLHKVDLHVTGEAQSPSWFVFKR